MTVACALCSRPGHEPICSRCLKELPPKRREAAERALATWRAEISTQEAERKREDQPVYMYEADEKRFTVYGVRLPLAQVEQFATDCINASGFDGNVSWRGFQYMLADTAELREKWGR